MADDFFLPEAVDARATKLEKSLKTFIIIAAFFLGGALVWLFGITPFRPFTRIDISGIDTHNRAEILSQAGITTGSCYLFTNVKAVEKALLNISSVESARVFKHFPDRLQIVLEGRKAVASAFAGLNGRTIPVLFDSQGVIFRIGADMNDAAFPGSLPIISGLVIEDPYPGMRLPAMFISLLKDLEKIQMTAPELLLAVSEIRINRKPFDSFDLIIYPVHRKIRVTLSELNADMLRYTLLMLDVLASGEGGIESLDFRSGIASYKPLEAHSE